MTSFETLGKKFFKLLRQQSNRNAESNVNSYRFRRMSKVHGGLFITTRIYTDLKLNDTTYQPYRAAYRYNLSDGKWERRHLDTLRTRPDSESRYEKLFLGTHYKSHFYGSHGGSRY